MRRYLLHICHDQIRDDALLVTGDVCRIHSERQYRLVHCHDQI
jgi:hypothetical protein